MNVFRFFLTIAAACLLAGSALPIADVVVPFVMKHAGRDQETVEQLKARAQTIDEALKYEAKSPAQKAAVLTLWKAEARFARDVHAGGVGKLGSDDGRAKCLGQIHVNRKVPRAVWETLGGLDLAATRRCAWATLTILEGKMRYCRVWYSSEGVAVGFHAYATGKCPKGEPNAKSRKRAATWVRLHHALSQ